MWYFDDSAYIYNNHTLIVDLEAAYFRVIFTDFKNSSNDLEIEPLSRQTHFPNGTLLIEEVNFTSISYFDENQTSESYFFEWN